MILGPRPQSIAAVLVLFLTNSSAARPNIDSLGIVTQARSASLGTSTVSPGASLYDGDRLWTGPTGALSLRSGSSMVYLSSQSAAILRKMAGQVKGAQFDLIVGTVVFSAAQAADIEIGADHARVRPATDASTLGQITIVNPTTFEIHARRGALKIEYRDDTQTIVEGTSYRVLLDDSNDDTPSTKTAPGDQPKPIKARSRKRKRIVLIVLGGAAAAGATLPWIMSNDFESPDHP